MIEKIQQIIGSKYNVKEPRGIFFSAYDANNSLIVSSGVVSTDKSLEKVIDMIYHWLIETHSNIVSINCDIIKDIKAMTSMEEVMASDMKQYGICASTIDHSKSWVVLPGTVGINTASDALGFIKSKHNLTGNITIYLFTTERIFIN